MSTRAVLYSDWQSNLAAGRGTLATRQWEPAREVLGGGADTWQVPGRVITIITLHPSPSAASANDENPPFGTYGRGKPHPSDSAFA